MIGRITTGKSFRGCLSYLHEGRLRESQELQLEEMAKKQAEVLHYNNCFGTNKQVIRQLVEVSRLNPNLARPVFHASLSFALADGGLLDGQQKADIGISLARSFGFDRNQFIVISHDDTEHEHIHIVGNRVGYDGKTAGDGNSYKRIAEFCREMEKEYSLTQILTPNRFLRPEQRNQVTSRLDSRKERLKEVLDWAISKSTNIEQVKTRMEKQGYQVELARGIAFTDEQLVRTKGSDIGYSLSKIVEELSSQQLMREQEQVALKRQERTVSPSKENKSKGLSI